MLNILNSVTWEDGAAEGFAQWLSFNTSLKTLNLRGNDIGPEVIQTIARGLSDNTSLTSCNVLYNSMDVQTAKMLVNTMKRQDLSLCGIIPDQPSVDYSWRQGMAKKLQSHDAVLLASDLSKPRVTGSLTDLNLMGNEIGDGGAATIAKGLSQNYSLTECNVRGNQLDKTSATLLAEVAGEKSIMLFGIKHDQTEANFTRRDLGPVDVILIASDLSVSKSLKECNMRDNKLDTQSAERLAKVAGEKGIMLFGIKHGQTEAEFKSLNLRPADAILIASDLSVSDSLKTLNIENSKIGTHGVTAITTALKKRNSLTELHFLGDQINASGAMVIADMLRVNSSLKSLHLTSNRLCNVWKEETHENEIQTKGEYSDEGILNIAKALNVNHSLTDLDLRENSITGNGAVTLSTAVLKKTTIEMFNQIPIRRVRDGGAELYLRQQAIGDVGAMVVAGLLPQTDSLTTLDLYNSIGPTVFSKIAEALNVNASLTSVNVLSNGVDVDSANVLLGVKNNRSKLRTLCGLTKEDTKIILNGGGLGIGDVVLLADEIRDIQSLKTLDLMNNSINATGAKKIAESINNISLTHLNMSYNHIDNERVGDFAELLSSNDSLTNLDLRYNNITGGGAEKLSRAVLNNPTIEVFNQIPIKEIRAQPIDQLILYSRGIGDAGAMVVAGLLPQTISLRRLYISLNSIGSMGARKIAESLRNNHSLRYLDIGDNLLNETDKQELRDAVTDKSIALML